MSPTTAKKSTAKKSTAKKSTAKKSTAKKSTAKKRAARKAKPAADTTATITVKQIKSSIGTKPKHRGTLRALGLDKIGSTNTLPDRPEIRGMIARVPHLLEVSDSAQSPETATGTSKKES